VSQARKRNQVGGGPADWGFLPLPTLSWTRGPSPVSHRRQRRREVNPPTASPTDQASEPGSRPRTRRTGATARSLSRSNARSNAEPYAARASSGRSTLASSLRTLFTREEAGSAAMKSAGYGSQGARGHAPSRSSGRARSPRPRPEGSRACGLPSEVDATRHSQRAFCRVRSSEGSGVRPS
jgi:hypothetical protein